MMKFPALWICGLLLLVGGKGARAWGGLFNRFSPEMLSNMGYGSHGGSSYRPQPLFQVRFQASFDFLFRFVSVDLPPIIREIFQDFVGWRTEIRWIRKYPETKQTFRAPHSSCAVLCVLLRHEILKTLRQTTLENSHLNEEREKRQDTFSPKEGKQASFRRSLKAMSSDSW